MNGNVSFSWGTGKALYFPTGNIGIGTATPNLGNFLGTTLSVKGTSDLQSGVLELVGQNVTSQEYPFGALSFGNYYSNQTIYKNVAEVVATHEAATGTNHDAAALAFWTRIAGGGIYERMRVTSTGNVGIGTSTPNLANYLGTVLSIKSATNGGGGVTELAAQSVSTDGSPFGVIAFGHSYVSGSNAVYSNVAQAMAVRDGANDAAAWTVWTRPAGGTITERFRVSSTGNVGVGGVNLINYPGRLAVQGPVGGLSFMATDGFNSTLALSHQSTPIASTVFLRGTGGSSLLLGANETGTLMLNANGNVGIGQPTPNRKLHVTSSGTTEGLRIDGVTSGVNALTIGSPGLVSVDAAGIQAGRFSILESGYVGVGAAIPATKLDVIGSIRAGAVTLPTSGVGVEIDYNATTAAGNVRAYDRTAPPAYKTLTLNDLVNVGGGMSSNVAIGDSINSSKLLVKGMVESSLNGFKFPDGTIQTTAFAPSAGVLTPSGGNLTIAGTLGIGNSSVPGVLQVSTSSSNTTLTTDNGTPIARLSNTNATASNFVGMAFNDGAADSAFVHAIFTRNAVHSAKIAFATRDASTGAVADKMTLDEGGNLTVTGSITGAQVFGAVYQDIAEWVPSSTQLAPGTVVVLDPETANQVMPSHKAYDTTVAGVVSAQPGVILGRASDTKSKIATVGRVRVRVDGTKHPIHIGDLLVTSDMPGVAMVSEPVDLGGTKMHRPGTLIGKALEPMNDGQGEILVLLSLQ